MSLQLSLLGDAPIQLKRPTEPILRTALIEGNYRRWLKRQWGPGPCIGWGMLNPSDASGLKDDPTLWRIMGFSLRWGFGSLVVGNLYPFISASPAAMHRWRTSFAEDTEVFDLSARDSWIRNMYDCAELFRPCEMVVAAWGNGADRDDMERWLDIVEGELGGGRAWHCLGTTNSGAPKHPLARGLHRVSDDQKPLIWRAAA